MSESTAVAQKSSNALLTAQIAMMTGSFGGTQPAKCIYDRITVKF